MNLIQTVFLMFSIPFILTVLFICVLAAFGYKGSVKK